MAVLKSREDELGATAVLFQNILIGPNGGREGDAFLNSCQSPGLTDTADRMTKLVATQIIEAAKTGERDPVRP